MNGVVTVGEVLIDFIPIDKDISGYLKNPGGAPANVAAGVAKLGGEASFIGTVGNDLFGEYLIGMLNSYQVNTDYVFKTDEARTQVVFVNNDENGERSFVFYIDKGADQFLNRNHICENIFDFKYILHFGSISLIQEPTKSAVKSAVEMAKQKGLYISFDPNIRINMWESKEKAKAEIVDMFKVTDILKISEEELEYITGEKDVHKAVECLNEYNITLILVTFGAEGSGYYYDHKFSMVKGIKINAIDTTGAGDAFMAAILYQLASNETSIDRLTNKFLNNMLKIANISGAITVSSKGAIYSLPTLPDIQRYLDMLD